jgi:hypothetical protein
VELSGRTAYNGVVMSGEHQPHVIWAGQNIKVFNRSAHLIVKHQPCLIEDAAADGLLRFIKYGRNCEQDKYAAYAYLCVKSAFHYITKRKGSETINFTSYEEHFHTHCLDKLLPQFSCAPIELQTVETEEILNTILNEREKEFLVRRLNGNNNDVRPGNGKTKNHRTLKSIREKLITAGIYNG